MKYNDIAVIGMSLLMPGAENTDELHDNLAAGKDLVRKVPESRFRLHGLDPQKEYIESGYLENIEMFDNKFFNISDYESKVMSPEQRLSLELSAKAIEDAGYALSRFRGKNCGVFFASSNSDGYYNKTKRKTSTSAIGTVKSMITGKIGYYFDLTGANIVYDTGCSSALVAVHEACIKLMTGEIDYALVGGIHVLSDISESRPETYDVMGLGASDYRSHSFDASASGVGLGEGGGVVILKRLSDAEKDRDPVYAVVKSGCVNGDGGRCSSATIPSVEGQREVIEKSWNDCPDTDITEIEAHGIGTKIGDSVEAQSIMECLKRRDKTEGIVYLSCVKSCIGHLVEAAGISSMIKAITGFENDITYKITNFNEPNPAIDFDSSVLTPVKENILWNGTEKRAAGIDSFGLSGANAHIVIENYIKDRKWEKPDNDFDAFVKLSAKTKTAFFNIREKLTAYLDRYKDINYRDFVCTLNGARDDYRFRRAVYAENAEELREALEQISPVTGDAKKVKYVFCMKADKNTPAADERIKQLIPSLAYESGIADSDTELKYKFFRLFSEMGIKPDIQLIDKTSKLIAAAAEKGDPSSVSALGSDAADGDYSKIISIINDKSKSDDIVLVNFGYSKELKNAHWENSVRVFDLTDIRDIRRFIVNYYNSGNDIDWSAVYSGSEDFRRIHIPAYEFDKIRHWPEEEAPKPAEKPVPVKAAPAPVQTPAPAPAPVQTPAPAPVQPQPEETAPAPVQQTAPQPQPAPAAPPAEVTDSGLAAYCEKMEAIWRNVFDFNDQIGYDEDFFDLGGNSLMMQQISSEINKTFDTEFDIYEIYDNPTISQLSERLMEFIENE
ncbi:MAG: hypothetical protein IKQ90_08280 [Ruminococcus sp.]|nr:hypothetical protein [Ruminococcus sp.]